MPATWKTILMTTDILYFQALICSLKGQLEDIKCINLEMYTKLAVGAVLIMVMIVILTVFDGKKKT